jgi:uncharacterized protein DUF5056
MNNLDELLAQPLTKIADNDFSQKVMQRLDQYYRWRTLVLKSLSIILMTLFFIVSPTALWLNGIYHFTQTITKLFTQFNQSSLFFITQNLIQQPLIIAFIVTCIAIFFSYQSE